MLDKNRKVYEFLLYRNVTYFVRHPINIYTACARRLI
jgi:hypothetical protein